LVAFGAVLAVVLLFGFVRLNLSPTSKTDETVRVAGITARSNYILWERIEKLSAPSVTSPVMQQELQSHWNAYFEATAREAQAGAKVITWPELAVYAAPSDEASYIARSQEVAHRNGIYLTVPYGITDPETGQRLENKLVMIDPTGAIVMEHVKYGGHIIEGGRLGDGILQTVDTPFGVLSAIICYDGDYPAVVQQSGLNGTGLMLVPSSDWLEIDPIHSQMAVFRAVENGLSLVRQTHGSLSIAVDAYGHVLAQTDFFGATDRTMVAQVPAKHVATLYTAFGRWIEWLFVAGFVLIVGWAVFPRRMGK
jgi:apolipoprotein N-acyltransferase